MSEYPRVLYHTSIRRPRNAFGRLIEGAEPIHTGDLMNPGYPIPIGDATPNKGHSVGIHFVGQHHYKTMICVVRDSANGIDEEASKVEEERLATEGWVRHPSELKEEYEDTDN